MPSVRSFIARQAFVHTIFLVCLGRVIASAGDATARWSWQEPQSKVLPTGDLQWAPQPFEFKPGSSIRYIDFDSGNDTNDGLSKADALEASSLGPQRQPRRPLPARARTPTSSSKALTTAAS